jgi:uncharacterized membrane-anchored protein
MKNLFYLTIILILTVANAVAKTDPWLEALSRNYAYAYKKYSKNDPQVNIAKKAIFRMPPGYMFVPAADALGIIEPESKADLGAAFQGIIISTEGVRGYYLYVYYYDDGHVEDSDGKKLDDQVFLDKIKAKVNLRLAKGLLPFMIEGWKEKTKYNSKAHLLIWAWDYKIPGELKVMGIEKRGILLGRGGRVSIVVQGLPWEVEKAGGCFQQIIDSLKFNEIEKYERFLKGRDKEYEGDFASLFMPLIIK